MADTALARFDDDIARWRADAAFDLKLAGVELVAALDPGPGFPATHAALAGRLGAEMTVVDLAARSGAASAWLSAASGATVIGVESAPGCRDAAHRLFPALDVRAGTPTDTGLVAGCADVVVAIDLTSRTTDLTPVLDEARRLLRLGGFVAVLDLFGTTGSAPNGVMRTIDATARAAARAGFDVEIVEVPARRGCAEAPTDCWAAAGDRLTDAVVDAHRGSPVVTAWRAERRRLTSCMSRGDAVPGCLVLRPL